MNKIVYKDEMIIYENDVDFVDKHGKERPLLVGNFTIPGRGLYELYMFKDPDYLWKGIDDE